MYLKFWKSMRHKLRLFASCYAIAVALPAQNPSRPDPDGTRLTVGTDSLAIYVIQGRDTTRTGILHDELRILRDGNRDVLRRVYQSTDQILGSRTDTITDGLRDLHPVQHRSYTDRGLERIDFIADRARGWMRLANGDSVAVESAVAGAFNASSFDLVLRASSLKSGWHATVMAFASSARATLPLTARVIGDETIAGEVCWRVQAEFGGTPVTFWISQKSRRLMQQLMVLHPDMQILFRTLRPAGVSARAI